jgi:hypothetical protein
MLLVVTFEEMPRFLHAHARHVHSVHIQAARTHATHVNSAQAQVLHMHVMHVHAGHHHTVHSSFMEGLLATCQLPLYSSTQMNLLWITNGKPVTLLELAVC